VHHADPVVRDAIEVAADERLEFRRGRRQDEVRAAWPWPSRPIARASVMAQVDVGGRLDHDDLLS
jgi:hypothetical protein